MKILNIGSLNYDYVYTVNHIVKPKETTSSLQMEVFQGGKGLNQSVALSRAGQKVYHVGLVGADGDQLIECCKQNDIVTDYIRKMEGKSGHTIIQVDKEGQNCILLYGGSNRCFTKEYIDEVLTGFEAGDWLLLQNEVNLLNYIIDKAYEKGLTIALNPSPYDSSVEECDLSKISLFLLNEVEGEQITGFSEPNKILDAIISKYNNSKVVLTLGENGVIYADKDQRVSQGIFQVEVVDTTAAGDTFTGYFLHEIITGVPVESALNLAAKASAIAVSKVGATNSIPYRKEVMESDLYY